MGFDGNYIKRGFKVYEKNFGTQNYNINTVITIISRIINKDKQKRKKSYHYNISALNGHKPKFNEPIIEEPQNNTTLTPTNEQFVPYLTMNDAQNLKVNDKIDFRDDTGRFAVATIIEKEGSRIKLHFDGWSKKWDRYTDYTNELHKFAKLYSISKRPSYRFKNIKMGDFIDINPVLRHPGWIPGEIRKFDKYSGQVQIVYEKNDKNYLYWAHLDDPNEIAKFTSKSGTNVLTQIQIQKKILKKQTKKGNIINIKQQNNVPTIDEKKVKESQFLDDFFKLFETTQQINQGEKEEPEEEIKQNKIDDENKQLNDFFELFDTSNDETINDFNDYNLLLQNKYPKLNFNEIINNKYQINEILFIKDINSLIWNEGIIIEKYNNWILIHYIGFPSKFDEKLHIIKDKNRIKQNNKINSFNQFLIKNNLILYKLQFKKSGIESLKDFLHINNKTELKRVLNDLKLPFILEKKFISCVLPYTNIVDEEGL